MVIRTLAEMEAVAQGNPFLKEAGIDESKHHVTFLADDAPPAAENLLAALATAAERFHVVGREIHLHLPDGYGHTKLSNAAIETKLSRKATTRSWKTVCAFLALAKS